MEFLIEKALDAFLEASGIKEKVNRSERLILLKKKFNLDSVESLSEFEDVYAYAVVAYAFDNERLCKPRSLVKFFKRKGCSQCLSDGLRRE